MAYDPNNVFAKILRGEIPCNKLYENDVALAFYDISPQAPTHVLVIPKGPYESWQAFTSQANELELAAFMRTVSKVAQLAELTDGGYRMISNCGINGGQEVPHFHIHLVGGGKLGRMLPKET